MTSTKTVSEPRGTRVFGPFSWLSTSVAQRGVLAAAVAVALSGASSGLAAQSGAATAAIDEIVVTSRVPVPLRQIGTSVTVVTEQEIEARGNLSIVDVLRQMPAIATSNNGGAGKSTSLRIRGEEGFRTLTILDGIRLSDPSSTQMGTHLEHVLSDGVGRVEILRGPQGLSYGADAGGIVNISSRQADEGGLNAHLNAQYGRFDTQQYSASIGGDIGRGDFFLSTADFRTRGFNTMTRDPSADDDGYDNNTLHGRIGFDVSEALRFDLVHRLVSGSSEYDGCSGGNGDCSSDFDLSASRIGMTYDGGGVTHGLSYATTRTDRENFTAGQPSYRADGELNRWEYVGTAPDLPGFNLVWGLDHEEAVANSRSRDNLGLYLEYLSDFSDNIFVTGGVRHDDNDDFGTNFSYRVSGAYLIDLAGGGALKLKTSYGTGFRAPSPYEMAYNAGPDAFAPAAEVTLTQESTRGYEAGVEYLGVDGFQAEVVYFHQRVEDAIFYDITTRSGYLQDIGASESSGIELSGQWNLGESWRFVTNYTWNDTERPGGWPRRRRPEHLFNAGVSYFGLADSLNVNAFYRLSRDSYDELSGNLVKLDDFAVLDLSLTYALSDNFQLHARVENLSNEQYQEVINYNTPGRAIYAGFKMNLRFGR